MAKHFDLENCSLMGELGKHLRDEYSMVVQDYLIEKFYRVIFRSSAMMVKYHKTKDSHKTGFSFKDKNGEFVYGVILTYNAPEDEESEDGGHWSLDFTFNKDDMNDVDNSLDNYSDVFPTILQTDSYDVMHVHTSSNEDLMILTAEFMAAIIKFLDMNSNDSDEEVEVEQKGIFKATVGIENGKKYYTLTPGSAIKQIVKGDDETEKSAAPKIKEIEKESEQAMAKAALIYRSQQIGYIGRQQDANGFYHPFQEIHFAA